MIRRMPFVPTCLALATLAALGPAAPAHAGETALRGFVDSFGYGYVVRVAVNGTPVAAVKGGGQQAVRLFAVDHPLRAGSAPEMAALFILKEGENTISVDFRKEGDAANPLQVKFEVPDRYDRPLFHLTSAKRDQGAVERTIVVEAKMPPSFATVEITDADLAAP
ncbi:MAG TPA: hypothetical protein VMZ50_11810 [Phycisphaerae bacterium]|nr:hypothetical protein [Phycisphaerae bacterium]